MKFHEYVKFDARGLADLVAHGEVTIAELLDLATARADAINPQINALVRRFDARAKAQLSGRLLGPFAGVPFLLKDLMADYAGEVTSSGSALFADYVPQQDSELVRRYKAAGLVIFGKTNTPELGLTPFTEPRLFGPARNPWNLAHTPGGSSGGSGAAIAAGIVPMANGGDGGGSIRIPASCNGLVGYKPSRGLIPHGPNRGDSWWGYATEHVLSRSVRDSAAALDATAGADAGCPYATTISPTLASLNEAPQRLRIAFTAEPMTGVHMHADCRTGLAATVQRLQDLGHELVETAPRIDREAFIQSFVTMLTGETAAALQTGAKAMGRAVDLSKVEPGTRALARLGRAIRAEEASLTRLHLGKVTRDIGHWFQDYDILLTPTLGMPPFRIGALQPSMSEQVQLALLNGLPIASLIKSGKLLLQTAAKTFEWMPNTPVFNVTGQPSISLPLHWNADGLPIGMMLSARLGDDARLLRLAAQIEQAYPWFDRRPAI